MLPAESTMDENAMIGGMITAKNIKYTKQNKTMAFLTVEDLYGSVEVIVFPRQYERYQRIDAGGFQGVYSGTVLLWKKNVMAN